MELVEDFEDVHGEVLESIGGRFGGGGAAAVAAQIDGDRAGGIADPLRDGFVETAAEAVGVQEHDWRTGAAPIEGADGHASVAGEVDDLRVSVRCRRGGVDHG